MSETLLVILLGSSVLVAIITVVGNIIMWRLNRKASKEDKRDEIKQSVDDLRKEISDLRAKIEQEHANNAELREILNKYIANANIELEALQASIRNTILHVYYKYLPYRAIPCKERENLSKLVDVYIHGLKGNSFVEDIEGDVKEWLTVSDDDLEYFCEKNKIVKRP